MFSENNYKKTFVVMTVVLFLVFLAIYFLILNRKKTSPVVKNIISPTPYPIIFKTEGSNYINWINNINPPVNGFSFMNKVLVYSNPNGFYEGYSNKLIHKENILNTFWTAQGQALFNNGSK